MTTGVSIANADLLFQHYLYDVVESLNHNSMGRQMVPTDYSWKGKELEWRVHTGRNVGMIYGEDGGAYPEPGKQTHQVAKATRRFLRGKIQLTTGMVATGTRGEAVAAGIIETEMRGLMRDLLHFEDFFYFRDGTGSHATLSDADLASSATDVQVEPGAGLIEGMKYDVLDSSASFVSLGQTTVDSVEASPDATGKVLVNFSNTVASAAANDILVPYVGTSGNMYNKAIQGFDYLVSDSGTVQNIDTATYPRYTGLVLDNGGTSRNLTPNLFRQMLAGLKNKSGSMNALTQLKMACTNNMAIEVEELYEGEVRVEPRQVEAGFLVRKIVSSLGEVEVYSTPNAIPGTMFFLDAKQIKRAVQYPLSWHREPGGLAGIFKTDHGTAVYTAVAEEICNLIIMERHTSGKITDLNEDLVTAFGW